MQTAETSAFGPQASPFARFRWHHHIQTGGVSSFAPPKVWKASPEEKVGVMAKKGGRPSVVEYSASGQIHETDMSSIEVILYDAIF